jgi:hypothetical protein
MPIAARLHRHRRDDTVSGAFQQVSDERSADAEPHRHELTDAKVVHQADMVVGVGVPCSADLQWPSRLATLGIRRSDLCPLSILRRWWRDRRQSRQHQPRYGQAAGPIGRALCRSQSGSFCRMLAIAEILAAPFKNALFAPENS